MSKTIFMMASLFVSLTSYAQYGDLGTDVQPEPSEHISPLIYYGEVFDFSGGYHVGDTAMNFTIYDKMGDQVTLYDELASDKPVILVSGSVSCNRFRDVFASDAVGTYLDVQNYIDGTRNDFNWIFVYGVEAHPTDGNCPSNCPPSITTDTTVLQHPDYNYRLWALQGWLDSQEHTFDYRMYADNPDNAVYNTFFQKAFGILVLNCDGTVAMQGDWLTTFIPSNIDALTEFKENYTLCTIDWPPTPPYSGEAESLDDQEDTVGVSEIDATQISIYPNPSTGLCAIEADANATIEIRGINGQLIETLPAGNAKRMFNTTNLANGIYFAVSNLGNTAAQKLVVLH